MFGKVWLGEKYFYDLFEQHAQAIVEAARIFSHLVADYDDPALRKKYTQEIGDAERLADRLTQQVNRAIRTTFITPLGKDQIHSLINTMDDVVDLVQDAAETMALYDVRSMTPEIVRLTELSVKCCERLLDVVVLLRSMSDRDTADAILKTCEEIDRLESDADRVMRGAISSLFREEEDVRELIKLKAIYETLETITDKTEDVAQLVVSIMLGRA